MRLQNSNLVLYIKKNVLYKNDSYRRDGAFTNIPLYLVGKTRSLL